MNNIKEEIDNVKDDELKKNLMMIYENKTICTPINKIF